jgi:hypothetical protein
MTSVPSVPIINIKPKASLNQLEFYWSPPQDSGTNNFTPNTIASLKFWLDANDDTTITRKPSSQYISQITEKVSQTVFTTVETGDFLMAQPASIGSNQSLWFNNQFADNVFLQGTFNMPNTGSAMMLFTAKTQALQTWRGLFGTNVSNGLTFEYINGLSNKMAPGLTNVGNGNPEITVTPGTTYLIYFSWDSDNYTSVGLFGQSPIGGNLPYEPIAPTSVLRIGTDTGTNVHMNLGELLFFDTNLNSSDRQRMEGYLAWKWGLTSQLPLDHPYKTNDPRTGAAPIQGYTLTCPELSFSETYGANISYALVTENVQNVTDYYFSLSAYNLNGSGPNANFLVTQAGIMPTNPTNMFVFPINSTTFNITWNFSKDDPLEADTKWFVISAVSSNNTILRSARGHERRHVLQITTPGAYKVIVYAVNDVGYSYAVNQNSSNITVN